jgi:hypothetical protein
VLTPKISTRKKLTCEPNLAEGHHSAEGFSSKHSVKVSAVGSASSFDRRTIPQVKAKSIRECMMTWIEYKEGDELMMDTRRT